MMKRSALFLLALLLPLAPATQARMRAADAVPGMVSAADPRAAAAGVEILRAGGSATDAAIATMLALNIVEPQNSGLGGGSFLIHHDGRTGALTTIDGREAAPSAADARWFYGADGQPLDMRAASEAARAAGVPGNLRMMAAAHERYGKLPWARLFRPAIRLASKGFAVSNRLHNGLNLYGRHVTGWARQVYFDAKGEAVPVGATLRNPEAAALMKRIARLGPDSFYVGPQAQKIVTALNSAERTPSKMTMGDLASYEAKDRDPVCGSYRLYRICSMGPPGGGVPLLLILKQLERFDLGGLGRNSPVGWHLFAESTRLAYADRDMYLADPDFIAVPVAGLLDPAYIAQRSALISPDGTMATIAPGKPAGAPERVRPLYKVEPGTSDLAVADAAGNVIQVTTTINGYFGNGVAVDGIMLNNELTDFDFAPVKDGFLVANRVEGGKRPRSSMSPTIVYDPDGKVRLAIGAAGGSTIIAQVAKAIIGVVDWKMSAQDAIAMGLIFAPGKTAMVEEGSELVSMLPALQQLGEEVKIAPLGLKANAIERVEGRWVGAADPRSEGVAMATDGSITTISRRSNPLNGTHE